MQNLLTRSISALVYAIIFISAILYSVDSYSILIALFAIICLWEFTKLIQFKNFIPYLLLPLIISYLKWYVSERINLFILIATLLSSIQLLYNLYKHKADKPQNFMDKLDLCIRYVILPFTYLMILPIIENTYQPYIIIYIVILIWTNDSFAYLVGKNFGKTKLFEKVSPKKTIEGFIGGLVFSLIIGVLIGYISATFSILNWIIIALIVSIFGTLGDLIESKFKRQANVKDSGTIMPGHGGLLDRLDSLYFLAPFVYLYIHFLL
ncbi:Phosphatidate cytidylyltransferase [Tenacibaculum sp. 190524A02b]|uniref:Phosphatidate cytidylyltransferase n=1 Tax=Tenacibaculum vairaonense TaxID=3137860 RepID=A0ABP1F9K9_9FLAO